jgi:hypothetical protein
MMNWWKYLETQQNWRVIKLPSNGLFNFLMVLSHPFMIGNCQKLQWVLTGGTLVVSLNVPWILWRIVCLCQSDRWHSGHSGSARVPLGWTGQPNHWHLRPCVRSNPWWTLPSPIVKIGQWTTPA